MQVGSTGASAVSALLAKPPETAGAPDHDSDGDNKGGVKSATAAGVGTKVDTTT